MDDVYDDHDNDDPLAIGGVLELMLDFHKYNVHFLNYKFLRGTLWCKYLRKSPPTNEPERGGDKMIYVLVILMKPLTAGITHGKQHKF